MVFIVEAFFSGCISKVVNDSKDYSWDKIKRAINDKNNCILSTKIYHVIERALNIVTDKKFKDTDKLYNAIERIFYEFKNNGDSLESVKCGLSLLGSDVSDQSCESFLEKFYEEIRQDDDLYKEVIMNLQQKGIKISQEEFQRLNEKIDENHTELIEKIGSINDSLKKSSLINEENITTKKLKFQNNKKQDYIKIWNSRLFLHLDNDEKPITLADAFIMPDYEIYQYFQKISFSDGDTLDEIIEKFVNYGRTTTMLITGVPGMGKTTIVSWIAHKYETEDNLIILRFRDWDSEELDSGLLKVICKSLECKRKDLNEKLLVLDGFDEMKSLYKGEHILNEFFNDIKDLEKSKIIITSRPNYITSANFDNRIELLRFNEKKIQRFYQKIVGIEIDKSKIDIGNLEVIGIPVILYMAIMSNIDITKKSKKPELYNRIFAEKGGIFDKFSEYDSGAQIIRNPDNIEKYLKFLQKTAFMMFEKNVLSLLKEECEIPKLRFEGKKISILEFPIKHLFENSEADIEFIHTSIYEYFASEYIFNIISNTIKKIRFKLEDLAGIMGILFHNRILSPEIIEFLEYRVRNGLQIKFNIVNDTFTLMLEDGMTYYTGECYRNIINCELRVFENMLEIIHLWDKNYIRFEDNFIKFVKIYIMMNNNGILNCDNVDLSNIDLRDSDLTCVSLKNAILNGAYLNGANLSLADLSGMSLVEASLVGTNLTRSYLSGVDLRMANLAGADLRMANLTGADLTGADLTGADLTAACLDEKQISYLKINYNLKDTRVFIEETGDILSYKEYCKRKH